VETRQLAGIPAGNGRAGPHKHTEVATVWKTATPFQDGSLQLAAQRGLTQSIHVSKLGEHPGGCAETPGHSLSGDERQEGRA
jgi:hypothetical protein